jgi:hypothetical protein
LIIADACKECVKRAVSPCFSSKLEKSKGNMEKIEN